ncbi:MAG: hypothetical protein NDJ75_04670 [Thermoanaerobaculia bacterium]|nr:hypothetical protein [Thermoanaerobaculia bacterium]
MSDHRPLAPAGLCAVCRHAEIVASPRSRFLRCRRAEAEPRYAKYPTLPVTRCDGFERRVEAAAPAPPADGDR